MEIYIDDREKSRIEPAIKFYTELGYNPTVTELTYGDYVFIDGDITVAFEYKTIEDYISSLSDYRVFNQAINQSNHFDYHFVIIVGTEHELQQTIRRNKEYTGRYMTLKEFYGSFASIVNFSSILQVPNSNHAFQLMESVARHCTDTKPVIKRFPKSRGSPAYRMLVNNVQKVGEITAKNICDTLGLVSIQDVLNIARQDLVKVDGVGDKKADVILEQLFNVFE